MAEGDPTQGSGDHDLILQARMEAEAIIGAGAAPSNAGILADVPEGYEVIREIHRGGQGAVYLAIQLATKRKVAIKVMHGGAAVESAGLARFEREVQVLSHLNHPNIVKIHDSGQTIGGQFYYVMDYVPGRGLDEHISANPNMKAREAIELFAKICDAINAAHIRGVIHRDLKPSNVRINPDAEPVVVDFGLAKLAFGDTGETSRLDMMTVTGQFVGSLPWASPEQAGGTPEAIDVRTDVYSLGVILYQMLTHGRFPYDVLANMRDVLNNILHAEPARPSTSQREIDDELDTIVLKCLSKERERRYQSAGELARDLRHYLRGEPIDAKRDSGLYVLRKTLRRYKPQVAVAVGFLVLLMAFLVVLSVLLVEVSRQRRVAQENFDAARRLARTFMFDFHDEIEPLRGTTTARQMILSEALTYLQSVRAKAGDDPAFLRELAEANDRVGDLLSGYGVAGTGDTERAIERYTESRQIRKRLVQDHPGDGQAHADLARSLQRAAWIDRLEGEFDQARTNLDLATSHFDTAIKRASERDAAAWQDQRESIAIERANILGAQVTLASSETETGSLMEEALDQLSGAVAYFQRRVDISPSDDVAQRWLLDALHERCMSMVTSGRLHNGAGDAIRESTPDLAVAEYDQAIEWFRESLRAADDARLEIEALLELNPASARLNRFRWMAWHDGADALRWIGVAEAKAGGVLDAEAARERLESADTAHAEALERSTQALLLAERLSDEDKTNSLALADVSVCLNKVGNELQSLGRLDEAESTFLRSLEIRRSIEASDPSPHNNRRLALAEFKLGDLAMARADAEPSEAEPHLQDAEGRYLRSLRLFEAITGTGREADDDRSAGVVGRRLEACRERIRQSRGSTP